MATRILFENYILPEKLTGISASSEAIGFDVENVFTEKPRTKSWRSGEYFEINSTNGNSFQFKEGALGPPLTAAVADGNYSGLASLLIAVQSAMNSAAGVTQTYTVTQNSGNVVFTTTGPEDLIIDQDPLESLLLVLGFILSDFSVPDLTYTGTKDPINSAQWIKFDLGITSRPNALVMIGKRNSPIQITPAATIKLQANTTDAWGSPEFETIIPYNERAILAFSQAQEGFGSTGYRYWRIIISNVSNPNNFIELSTVFLGRYFEPSRGRVQIPWSARYLDNSTTLYTENGNSFSTIRSKTDTFTMDWFGLTVAEKEEIDYIFDIYGTGKPFFVALDPMQAMSSSTQYYVRYIKLSDDPSVSLESPGVFSISMECREEI